MERLDGEIFIHCNNISYVSQQHWIQNATVKSNILFGSEIEDDKESQKFYDEVIHQQQSIESNILFYNLIFILGR